MAYNANIKAEMLVSAVCESCKQDFDLEKPVTGVGSGAIADVARQNALRHLQQQVDQIIQNKDYSFKKCPHCGYVQSWMQSAVAHSTVGWVKKVGYSLLWVGSGMVLFWALNYTDVISVALGISWQVSLALLTGGAILVPVLLAFAIYLLMRNRYHNPQTHTPQNTPAVGFGFSKSGAHAAVGMTLAQQGQFKGAMEHLNRAMMMNMNEPLAYGARGFVKFREGNTTEAVEDLRKYVNLAGKGADPKLLALLFSLDPSLQQQAQQPPKPAST